MSKMVKRMPWQPDETERRAPTPMRIQDLPPEQRHLLLLKPRRNPNVQWEEDEETGLVTLIYLKNLSPLEQRLAVVFKPVPELRRPLDSPGSFIWLMCDGENNIATICTAVDQAYKEDMEPVLKRVVGYLEILAKRGLIVIGDLPDEDEGEDREEGA
ncbi:MAG: PqqD family protein [Thermoplasmata archaeon]|nr:MAG: PqqD family protein [Thermoplasmata archaeon]